MGMHRWLLGPVICLILAVTSARPPECQEPPSWSINGTQPLAETKGKVTLVALLQASCQFCLLQASMLEALLNHFRSYGMNDLEFIIINSKLPHSQLRLEELQKRVSFSVYQETDEEEVWSLMEGGKDDMFIYDRCGRLTYFVPFPLSILNEYPLVSNAVLATYFRSPCGVTCERNGTIELGEIANNIENYGENETAITEDDVFYNATEVPDFDRNITANESSNDILAAIDLENNFADSNSTSSVPIADYDYIFNNDTMNKNETNNATAEEPTSYFESIYKLFFNTRKNNKVDEKYDKNITFNETVKIETSFQLENNSSDNNTVHVHTHQHHNVEKDELKPEKKSDRCAEADYAVCKSWSKKRLLHAQRCCSSRPQIDDDEIQRSCHHFGKRRCKKIQSILKCCIKTGITESALTTPEPDTTINPATESNNIGDVVCCRIEESEKFCRVSDTGICKEDELVEDSTNKSKCQKLPCRSEKTPEDNMVLKKPCHGMPCQHESSEVDETIKDSVESPCCR